MTQVVRLYSRDMGSVISDHYLSFLNSQGIQISFETGQKTLVMNNDICAVYAAQVVPNYYPLEVAKKLIRKDQMPIFLAGYGFNMLQTNRVRSVDDLPEGNFVLKPILGQTEASIESKNVGLEKRLVGKPNGKKADLLKRVSVEEINALLKTGYVAQEAVTGEIVEIITLSGTTNGQAEAYFVRNSRGKWRNGVIIESARTFNIPEAAKERELLRDFLKSQKVRNASFNLQLIVRDGKLYPMDWNFRLVPHFVLDCVKQDIREFHKALYHLLDIPNDLPAVYPDTWVTERKGMDLKAHMSQPLRVVKAA